MTREWNGGLGDCESMLVVSEGVVTGPIPVLAMASRAHWPFFVSIHFFDLCSYIMISTEGGQPLIATNV
jgi:hypothetical protein